MSTEKMTSDQALESDKVTSKNGVRPKLQREVVSASQVKTGVRAGFPIHPIIIVIHG